MRSELSIVFLSSDGLQHTLTLSISGAGEASDIIEIPPCANGKLMLLGVVLFQVLIRLYK